MIIGFALALEVTGDEILGLKVTKNEGDKPSLRILRRMKKIEALPLSQQKFLLKTVDTFLNPTS